MELFVLVDYEHEVSGAYTSEEKAWEDCALFLLEEGVPEDELGDGMNEWRVVEVFVDLSEET